MSLRPTSAVVRAVTDTTGVAPLSNRLHAVLAVGMRSSPVCTAVNTGVAYSDEPPDVDPDEWFGEGDDYREPYAKDDPRWSTDFEWVLQLVREKPYYVLLASKEFRKRRELAMAVVKGSGALVHMLSPLFRNDREIVKTALNDFAEAFEWVSDELKRDDDIIRSAFSGDNGGFVYVYLPEDLKQNRDYMRLAVKKYYTMFDALPESAKNDRIFVMELLELNSGIARYTVERYTDQEFWVVAVRAHAANMKRIPKIIPKTREFLLKLVQNNGDVLRWLMHKRKLWFESFKESDTRLDWKMDIEELENEPDFRLAAATAERNPNMDMLGAILHDLEAAISVLVTEKLLIAETESMRTARMERLDAYQAMLDKLAAVPVQPNGPMDNKIQELIALLNNPSKSKDLFRYRTKRDLGDMLKGEETEPSAKRTRVATEARALATGSALPRVPVVCG
jgi:hypothetical protein